jgi:outer membrane protein assembly factor BamB
MKSNSLLHRATLVALTAGLLAAGLAACEEVIPTDEPGPLLVTLPAEGFTPTASPPAADAPTPTGQPTATLVPQPIIPTPTPVVQTIEAARLLWTLEGVARPVALAPAGNRLAVLLADGRFLWLNGETGQIESTSFVWQGSLEGETDGNVASDGQVAVVVASQAAPDDDGTAARTRMRLVVFDAGGSELWSLAGEDSPRPVSTVIAPGMVIVGQAGRLLAYDLQSGAQVWAAALPTPTPTPSPAPTLRPTLAPSPTPLPKIESYRALQIRDERLYVLIDTPTGSGAAAFDPYTGVERWRWLDDDSPFEQMALDDDGLLMLAASDRLAALDAPTGRLQWQVSASITPEAGMSVRGGVILLAPAPTAEYDYRPGIMGISASDGTRLWQSLDGLLAGRLAGSKDYLWALVNDYDQGQVWLAAIQPGSGTETVRLAAGDHPEQPYHLVVEGQRAYVLGADLKVFGY